MLVNLKNVLEIAEANKCAIGSFNTPNMASLLAVIGAAEEMNQPVVIMHAQIHEEMGLCKMDEIAPVMLLFAERAKVPVCVHLDHGDDIDYVKRGVELGFTSVMYDGSTLPNELNYANTQYIRELTAKKGVSLEAEIGSMGERESGGLTTDESIYTDPATAADFAAKTGIDAIACAFGTVHGIYLKEPKLDFPRLEKIQSMINVPIVMHGGSGVSDEDYKKVIARGVRKVNYYTYMAKAGGTAVKNMTDLTYYHDIEVAAIKGMKDEVKKAIKVFAGLN